MCTRTPKRLLAQHRVWEGCLRAGQSKVRALAPNTWVSQHGRDTGLAASQLQGASSQKHGAQHPSVVGLAKSRLANPSRHFGLFFF